MTGLNPLNIQSFLLKERHLKCYLPNCGYFVTASGKYLTAPDRSPRADWQHKFLVTGLNPLNIQSFLLKERHLKCYLPNCGYFVTASGKYLTAPDRFPRADWQHKFLVTGLNPLNIQSFLLKERHLKCYLPNCGYFVTASGKYLTAPDRFPRADWQHKFLVTGLNPLNIQSFLLKERHLKCYLPNCGYFVTASGKYLTAPDRFPRADWQHKFLVTGLNPLNIQSFLLKERHLKCYLPNCGYFVQPFMR